MFSRSNIVINEGVFNSLINRTSRGMDILMEWVATSAFHNSDELYDAPKCHPHTRVAVLHDIMQWVTKSELAREDFMLWLFGPAGAGKSAIAKRIAEIAAEGDLLIADFFFSRISPTRNTKDRLIPTLAYQLAVSIPETRPHLLDAIERDQAIFNKNILTQIDTLLIRPFLLSISSTHIIPSPKLIIIDGLDECNDSKAQVAVLEAISHSFSHHNLPIKFLVVSRPEPNLVISFNCNEPLKSIHRRLALDDTYRPYDDIRLFFSDKFEQIQLTHPLKSTIPTPWPTQETLRTLVVKSSGQFIYASTVVKFVESICHRPSARLNIILGLSPPGETNPFAELDALYNHLLSSVDNIQLTLHVLSFYVMTSNFALTFRFVSMTPELFLSLEPGDTHLALINLSSIVTYDELSGVVKVMHASLVDFLSDRCRSSIYYIDRASTCTNFVRRLLRCVEGPDGIQAGDINLFRGVIDLRPWILKGQLRSDILNFDLDALINASIRWQYKERPFLSRGCAINAFWIWKKFLNDVGLEDREKKEALDRLNKSLESRLQIYRSDWRLQLLVPLAVANVMSPGYCGVPYCGCVDILLEMDDHDIHLVDQDALDLRHPYLTPSPRLVVMISRYVDGGTYASAALHCMRFLSNPPKHSGRIGCSKMALIHVQWKPTCAMTLEMLCKLLRQANDSLELVQFISNHDIHPAVHRYFSADHVWEVNVHILAFLSRASVCVNWRITSAIQRSLIVNDHLSSKYDANDAKPDEEEDPEMIQNMKRQRLDQCCSNVHSIYI